MKTIKKYLSKGLKTMIIIILMVITLMFGALIYFSRIVKDIIKGLNGNNEINNRLRNSQKEIAELEDKIKMLESANLEIYEMGKVDGKKELLNKFSATVIDNSGNLKKI